MLGKQHWVAYESRAKLLHTVEAVMSPVPAGQDCHPAGQLPAMGLGCAGGDQACALPEELPCQQ